MRTAQFSKNPQTYERGVLLTADLDVMRDELKQFKIKPRVPQRIVVNNSTFSIFETFDYTSMVASMNLKKLTIKNHEDDNTCIVVKETST